jgi:hypothetical protein
VLGKKFTPAFLLNTQNLVKTWPKLTPNKKGPSSIIAETLYCIVWAHQGMILGPPDMVN